MDTSTYMLPASEKQYKKAHSHGKRVAVTCAFSSADVEEWHARTFTLLYVPKGFNAKGYRFTYWVAVTREKYEHAVKHLNRYHQAIVCSADNFARFYSKQRQVEAEIKAAALETV